MITVTEDHPADAFTVHLRELGHIAYILGGMCLVPSLIDNEYAVLVSKVEIFVDRRIVRSAHPIEIELLENLEIPADHVLGHGMAEVGMLHVGIYCADLERLAVQIEYAFAYLGLLETYALCDLVHDMSGSVLERHLEVIKVGSLRRPFLRSGDTGAEVYRPFSSGSHAEPRLFHGSHCFSAVGNHCGKGVARGLGIECLQINRQAKVGVSIARIEFRNHLPVADADLGRGEYGNIIEDTGKTPVVLSLEIISVAVLHNHHGYGVLAGLHILGDIVLGGFLRTLVVPYLLSVYPYERARCDLLETQEYLLSLPGRREVEGSTIGSGRIEVHRDVGNLRGEGIDRTSADAETRHAFLLLACIGIIQYLAIAIQERLRHGHGERGADIAEKSLSEALHLPVGGDIDPRPLPVVERRLEEVFRNVIWRLEILETPFTVQGDIVDRDVKRPSGLLVQLEDRKVFHVIRQVLEERLVLCRSLKGDETQGKW